MLFTTDVEVRGLVGGWILRTHEPLELHSEVCVRARVCPCVACVDGEAPVSFIRLSKASVARRGLRTVHLRTSGSSTELWGLLLTLPLTRDSVALAKYSQPLPSACSVETVSPHGLL